MQQLQKIAFTTSHEIRLPICNLQGLISLLALENYENKEVKNILQCMQDSISSMDDFTRHLAIKLDEYKQNLTTLEKDKNVEAL